MCGGCSWMLLFHPGSWPGGQVEECPSTEWSVRPDQSRAQASRLRPGRWPELLAPLRSRNPPHISRARPYGHIAALHSEGRGADGRERYKRTTEAEEEEKEQEFNSTRIQGKCPCMSHLHCCLLITHITTVTFNSTRCIK